MAKNELTTTETTALAETNENLTYSDYSSFEKTATECGEAAAYLVKLLREKRYKDIKRVRYVIVTSESGDSNE